MKGTQMQLPRSESAAERARESSAFPPIDHSRGLPKWLWVLVAACYMGAAAFWLWWLLGP